MGLRLDLGNKEDRKFLESRGLLQTAIDAGMEDPKPRTKLEKRPKHGNIKTEVDGEKYDSIWEGECHRILKLLQRAGIILKVERQIKFKFHHNGIEIWGCVLDFKFTHKNGKEYLADSKTKSTSDNRIWRTHIKMLRAFEDQEVILFYNDKGNKTDVYSTVYNLV